MERKRSQCVLDNATRQAAKSMIRPNMKGVTPAERAGFNAAEIAQRATSFGFTTTSKIYRSDIQVITYGNLFIFGNLGGKGLTFRVSEKWEKQSVQHQ
jgi:hypothetical protein